jgi:hypothetical protein
MRIVGRDGYIIAILTTAPEIPGPGINGTPIPTTFLSEELVHPNAKNGKQFYVKLPKKVEVQDSSGNSNIVNPTFTEALLTACWTFDTKYLTGYVEKKRYTFKHRKHLRALDEETKDLPVTTYKERLKVPKSQKKDKLNEIDSPSSSKASLEDLSKKLIKVPTPTTIKHEHVPSTEKDSAQIKHEHVPSTEKDPAQPVKQKAQKNPINTPPSPKDNSIPQHGGFPKNKDNPQQRLNPHPKATPSEKES